MKVGILSPYDREQYEKALKSKKSVSLGIDAHQMFIDINALEVKHGYDMARVVHELKYSLMTILGMIQTEEEDGTQGDSEQESTE